MSERGPVEPKRRPVGSPGNPESQDPGSGRRPPPSVEDLAGDVAEVARKLELAPPPRSRLVIVRVIDHVAEALAALTLGSVTILLFANAAGRYVLSRPIGWAEEVATGLVVWITMLGVFITVRRRELITVLVLVRKLPESAQARLQVAVDLVGAAVLGYLAWLGVDYLTAFGGDRTPYLGFPKGFFTVAIPIGAAATALVLLAQAPRARRLMRGDPDRGIGGAEDEARQADADTAPPERGEAR